MSDKEKGKKEGAAAPDRDLQTLTDKCSELEHKYKLALADYQNLLKQTAKEKQEFLSFATEQFLLEILPVYDNLKMSFAHADESVQQNGWHKGVEYTIKQFKEALAGMGVEEIETAGIEFDYHIMEAVEKKPTDDAAKDGLVERELKSGYKLHGKVIAPARVSVWEFRKIEQ